MPYNLLLLPLLGGYIFLLFFSATGNLFLRQQGYHLIFFSATAGIAFLFVAYTTPYFGAKLLPMWNSQGQAFVPYGYLGTPIIALLVGVPLQFILNFLIKKDILFREINFQRNALEKYGSRLEKLLDKSMVEEKEVFH